MSQGWKHGTVDDFCHVQYGTRVVRKRDQGSTYPVYGGGGATFAMDIFNREDRVIISRFGMSEWCTRFVPGRFFLNDSGLTLSPRNPRELLPQYLDMWALAMNDEIYALGKGAAQKNLDASAFRSLRLSHPADISEQQRIVLLLDEAFVGVATAKANAEKNLRYARALFASHLQSVFSQRGEGWVERRIGDACTLKSGTSVGAALERSIGELPYLKVADMTHAGNEVEIVSSSRFLNRGDVRRNAIFPPGTTVFPKRGGSIMTNKKRLTAVPICADLNIMGVIPGEGLLPRFLYFYFLNVDMRQLGGGSSIPQINNYDIAPLAISAPESVDVQADIVRELQHLSADTQLLGSIYQRKLDALEELKKSLLHQAFSGGL